MLWAFSFLPSHSFPPFPSSFFPLQAGGEKALLSSLPTTCFFKGRGEAKMAGLSFHHSGVLTPQYKGFREDWWQPWTLPKETLVPFCLESTQPDSSDPVPSRGRGAENTSDFPEASWSPGRRWGGWPAFGVRRISLSPTARWSFLRHWRPQAGTGYIWAMLTY